MFKVDAAVAEKPVQFTFQLNSSSGEQPQADLEEVTTRDEENPEFKLPKMSSLVLVLMTNVLIQVISSVLPTQWISCLPPKKTPDLFFHHHPLVERLRGTVRRRRDVLRACHRYPDVYLSLDPRATLEVRQRYQIASVYSSHTSLT